MHKEPGEFENWPSNESFSDEFFAWIESGEPELLTTEAQEEAVAAFGLWMDEQLRELEARWAHLATPNAVKYRPNWSLTRRKKQKPK